MKLKFLIVCSVIAGLHGLQAERPKPKSASAKEVKNKDQVFPVTGNLKLEVKGVVCSFCAYGLTKKFSKLGFVDRKKFGGKGVYTDIEKGYILLGLRRDRKIDFKKIRKSILDGGYVLVRILVNLTGALSTSKKHTILLGQGGVQKFMLLDKDKKKFLPRGPSNKKINVRGEVLDLKKKNARNAPVRVVVQEYQSILR